jgi:beta-galactosidase
MKWIIKNISFITGLIFLFSTILCYAQMPKKIIIGTVYDIFNEEFASDKEFFEQVDRDIALMKASNIEYVMIFPLGNWDPITKHLKWERTDYLVKKIEDSQMKFIPLMLKEEQCSHYFPVWKFKEIKGMWDEYNLNNGNKNNRENVDFADPRVYPLVEDYFRQVIQRYGKSPALSFYNIWNEPHYSSTAHHVIVRFRDWLKKKYVDLSSLRRAWGKEYSDWDEVSPFLTDNWNSSMPQIDWAMFRNELDGLLLKQLVQTLRKYDSVHPVNANPVSTTWSNFNNFGAYNTDNWPVADYDDINGISYYPDGWERDHNLEPCPFWLHNLAFNTIRCLPIGQANTSVEKKNYILTELYTNVQNGLALNGYQTKESVNLLAWSALANDCKGLIYWQWKPFMRGRQSLGRGLCLVNGKLAPRGEAVKDLGAVIKKYGDTLYQAHLKKPQVAVLVDMVGLLKTLEQTTEPSTNKFIYESNAGIFKALYEENIGVDILRMDRGLDAETLKSYKIIYLPFQIVMRKQIADLLKEYVRQGGWVVADARTATVNELDFTYHTSPGAGLDELFGAVRPDWYGQKTYFKVRVKETNGHKPFEFDGKYFKDELQLKDSVNVIGTFENNDPAIIEHHYGKGTAVLSAVPLGASYFGNPDNPVNKFIINIAEEAGVTPDAQFISRTPGITNNKVASLDLKVHELNGSWLLYIINTENQPKSGTVEMNIEDNKNNSPRRIKNVKEIISENNVTFKQRDNNLSIPIDVNPNQVKVYIIE